MSCMASGLCLRNSFLLQAWFPSFSTLLQHTGHFVFPAITYFPFKNQSRIQLLYFVLWVLPTHSSYLSILSHFVLGLQTCAALMLSAHIGHYLLLLGHLSLTRFWDMTRYLVHTQTRIGAFWNYVFISE